MKKNAYETERGYTIKVRPFSGLLLTQIERAVRREFEERGEPLAPPVYTFETAGGDTETVPYDEKSIKNAPDEDVLAWSEYQNANERLVLETFNRQFDLEILECLEPPSDLGDAWERRQRRSGIEVPEDPDDKKIHLFKTVLLSEMDQMHVHFRIQLLTSGGSVSDDLLEAAEARFRRAMEADGRAAAARMAEQEIGDMENGDEVPGDESGEGVETEAE